LLWPSLLTQPARQPIPHDAMTHQHPHQHQHQHSNSRGWWGQRQRQVAEEAVADQVAQVTNTMPTPTLEPPLSVELEQVDQALTAVTPQTQGSLRARDRGRGRALQPALQRRKPARATKQARARKPPVSPSPQLRARMEEAQGALVQSADLLAHPTAPAPGKAFPGLTGEGEEFLERLLQRAGWQEELAQFLASPPSSPAPGSPSMESQVQYALNMAKKRIWRKAEEGQEWKGTSGMSGGANAGSVHVPPAPASSRLAPLDRETQKLLARMYDKVVTLAATHQAEGDGGGAAAAAAAGSEAERDLDLSLELLMLQGLDLLRQKALPRSKL
jgi:hypothetical protein